MSAENTTVIPQEYTGKLPGINQTQIHGHQTGTPLVQFCEIQTNLYAFRIVFGTKLLLPEVYHGSHPNSYVLPIGGFALRFYHKTY